MAVSAPRTESVRMELRPRAASTLHLYVLAGYVVLVGSLRMVLQPGSREPLDLASLGLRAGYALGWPATPLVPAVLLWRTRVRFADLALAAFLVAAGLALHLLAPGAGVGPENVLLIETGLVGLLLVQAFRREHRYAIADAASRSASGSSRSTGATSSTRRSTTSS